MPGQSPPPMMTAEPGPARRPRGPTSAPHADSGEANSLRRIGEALLLAQSRARASTERANRCERLLRTVLSQINLQSGTLLQELEHAPSPQQRSMSVDALSDWDLLHSFIEDAAVAPTTTASDPLSPELGSFVTRAAGSTAFRRLELYRPSPPPPPSSPTHSSYATPASRARVSSSVDDELIVIRDDDPSEIKAAAKTVVRNLHAAARNAERRIRVLGRKQRHRESLRPWLEVVVLAWRPWQLLASVVVSVAVGAMAGRWWLLYRHRLTEAPTPTPPPPVGPTVHPRSGPNDPLRRLHLAASRLPVTFAIEDMSHLLHPPPPLEVS